MHVIPNNNNTFLFSANVLLDNIIAINKMKNASIYLQYILRSNNFWKPQGNIFPI